MLIYGEPGKEINVNGVITGLTPGLHGFHINESADITGGCAGAGGIFNPVAPKTNRDDPDPTPPPHAAPTKPVGERKAGGLGNIEAG